MIMRCLALCGLLTLSCGVIAAPQREAPLTLIKTVNLSSELQGRFDHFAADAEHNRLFVVAKDSNVVLVLDLNTGRLIHKIDQLGEPQGVLYRPDLDRLYFADGDRGSVEIIDGKTYATLKGVKLRLNADAITYDPGSQYLYVVNGGVDAKMKTTFVSVVDTTKGETVGETEVDSDNLEAMALEKGSPTMYVDDRQKNAVRVIDRHAHKVVATWPVTLGKTLAAAVLDESTHRLFVGCRDGHIVVFDTQTGKELQTLPIGKGIDDLVFDAPNKRIYAACGESGTVDVYEEVDGDHFHSLGQIPSGPAARNGLLIASSKRYVVGVPKTSTESARILVFQVQ